MFKILKLVLSVFSILLLNGCGGGGGTSSLTSTVIDGFNLSQGTADTKLGATYLQEFLTEKSAESTTVSNLYSRIDLTGLESAHSAGWTGNGETITVLDSDFSLESDHGRKVSDITRVVSPGASRNEYNLTVTLSNSSKNIATIASDVITSSVGYTPSYLASDGTTASLMDDLVSDMEGSDALITIAAQHTNWTNGTKGGVSGRGGFPTCPDSGTMTVANCNNWAINNLDASNVIYVGEINSSNNIPSWSNQAGSTHKNQFIVTSSDEITTASDGDPDGNSFAAPRVAGAGALVRHKFPNLSGSQTATVILNTADDLGDTGVDSVYGHGKLNIGKALAPVGNLH
jgi:hypothetical protein